MVLTLTMFGLSSLQRIYIYIDYENVHHFKQDMTMLIWTLMSIASDNHLKTYRSIDGDTCSSLNVTI